MNLMDGVHGEHTFILFQDLKETLVDEFLEQREKLKGEFFTDIDNFRGYTAVPSSRLPERLVNRYMLEISDMTVEYLSKFKKLIPVPPMYIKPQDKFNLQHYEPGQCYKNWHTEFFGPVPGHVRALAFMTYLNDVKEGGETEFMYYKLKVKPKRGLTLMWPAGFTHTHRGCPAPHEEKMIVTGWCVYS